MFYYKKYDKISEVKKQNFYLFIISFFTGIFFETFFQIFSFNIVLIVFIFLFYFLVLKFQNRKIPKKIFLFFLLLLGIFLGTLRHEIFQKNNFGEFENLINQKIEKNFLIVDEPENRNGQTKLIVAFPNSKSKALLWTQNFPERNYGDLILVEGYLNHTKNFTSENGRDFDYISYLKKDNIFYEIKPIQITHQEKNQGNVIKEYLFKIKKSFLSQIKKLIPDPEASLLGGILLGAKEDMGKNLLENFRKTGVIHIVVLSGYNLSLVAEFFIKIFAFFGLTISAIFGGISIIFFTIMTGASSTIIRASIMALIILFARATGRESEAIFALFLAGFLMLLFNPALLVFDPSFQLSFLATLGLLVLSPKIEEKLKIIPKKFIDFRGILAATLSTQIFVFPILLYMMGEISIISPVVNVLILIFVPIAMLFGLIAVLFSYLNFYLGVLISFPVYLILSYSLFLVDYFAKLPFAVFETDFFGFYFMAFWYFLYIIIFFIWKRFKKY